MNIGLFGGTFDPIHRGHMALARAALERCKLNRIYFVPANVPPHKQRQPLSPFVHRYAMLTLALANEKAFLPSLLEGPQEIAGQQDAMQDAKKVQPPKMQAKAESPVPQPPNYTIDTVRRLKQSLKKTDRVFLLIGIDAFSEIGQWREAEALFRECEFVVASRPGYSLADVANALPESLRPKPEVTRPFHKQAAAGDLILAGVNVHLLENVHQKVSATEIREAAIAGKPLGRFVEPAVAEYIKKVGLYTAGDRE